MKRIAALLLCGALTMGALCGCNSKDKPYVPTGGALYEEGETEPTKPVITKTQITVPYNSDHTLNPFRCTDYGNRAILSLLYQGLFATDEHYESWPILCESYKVSWDMKTYTFAIADATFSDGSAVTADDVSASLKTAQNSDVYRGRFAHVEKISVTEENEVQIQLDIPCENLLILLDVPIVKGGNGDTELPIGSGPYVFTPGEVPVLLRQSNWWSDATLPVTAEKINLMEAGTPAQLRDAFEFSDLSMVATDPGSDQYADFHSDYELWECENGEFVYLACNKNSKILKDAEVRQALLRAIDRESIVNEFYNGLATPSVLPASPHSPYYTEALANQYTYDPSILAGLMGNTEEELPTDPDQEVELPELEMLVNKDDAIRVRVANRIAEDLLACGIQVNITSYGGNDYPYTLQTHRYDVYLGKTRLSPNMDLSAFFKADGKLSVGGLNDKMLYTLCQESLANIGNYTNLHQEVLKEARLCPILFQSYAIYTQRGSFYGLTPSRDNLFFYHREKTSEEVRVEE